MDDDTPPVNPVRKPDRTYQVLAEALTLYKPEGVGIWLFAKNRLLDGETPMDLMGRGEHACVLALLAALNDGAYL